MSSLNIANIDIFFAYVSCWASRTYGRGPEGRSPNSLVVSDLHVVRVVFIALPTPLDATVRARLMRVPLLAATLALDEILLGVLREDGLVQPLIAHHIKLRPRTRVGLEDLFTTYHISHNWE